MANTSIKIFSVLGVCHLFLILLASETLKSPLLNSLFFHGGIKSYGIRIYRIWRLVSSPLERFFSRIDSSYAGFVYFVKTEAWPTLLYSIPLILVVCGFLVYRLVRYSRRPEKEGDPQLKEILERFQFYYEEETRILEYDDQGEPVMDEYGRPVKVSIKHFPEVDLSGLPDSILFKKVHPKISTKISDYSHGFLKELENKGLISVNQGEIESTGYPNELRISLYQERVLQELDLFRQIGWFESKKVNNIKREKFPTVRVTDKEVIVDFQGINITEGLVYSGMEKFSNFHGFKLKNSFKNEGTRYFFKYQAVLNKAFEPGETILSKYTEDKYGKELKYIEIEVDKLIELKLASGKQNARNILGQYYRKILKSINEGVDYNLKEVVDSVFKKSENKDSKRAIYHFLKQDEQYSQSIVKDRIAVLENDPKTKINTYEEYIIKPMREHYQKTGKELIFVGELDDPNVTVLGGKTQLHQDISSSPSILIGGQTRSGKSKTLLSFIFTTKYAFPETLWWFADGKSSLDYDIFAERFSTRPVAKMSNGEDPLIELANVFDDFYSLYEHRIAKMAELSQKGFNASTYVEYNKYCDPKNKMSRAFLVVDEFKLFTAAAPGGKIEDLMNEKGTIWNKLDALLRSASSYGMSIIIASQRIQVTDFPSGIRSNLTARFIHMVNKQDAAFIGVGNSIQELSIGKYILNLPGMYCDDSKSMNLRCTQPYIGDEPKGLLDHFFPESINNKPFNYDLIYNRGKEDNLAKIGEQGLLKYIKQVFLIREGFTVLEEYNPTENYLALFATKTIEGKTYRVAIGVIKPEEVMDEQFYEKVTNERPKDIHTWLKFFFLQSGKLNQNQLLDLENSLLSTYFLMDIDYMRPLKKAVGFYKSENLTPIFTYILTGKLGDRISINEKLELDKPKASKFDMLTKEEYIRIRSMKGATAKGDLFERFCAQLERYYGHDTVGSKEIVAEGEFADLYTSIRNESGLDLLRWVNRREKRAVIIQCKNKPSRNLSSDVINKLIKTKEFYSRGYNIRVEGMLLYTSGALTRQARGEADTIGVSYIEHERILQILEAIEEKAFNEAQKDKAEAAPSSNPSPSKEPAPEIVDEKEIEFDEDFLPFDTEEDQDKDL